MRTRWLALAVLWASVEAFAHASGFHKKSQLSVRPNDIEILVSMDVDSGLRCGLLRKAADGNLDGRLSKDERVALKEKLQKMALDALKLRISGFPLQVVLEESKLDLRGDVSLSQEGMSVAVLARAELPRNVSEGMSLEVEDSAPDGSHIRLEIQQVTKDGQLLGKLETHELKRSGQVSVRLIRGSK